MDQKLIVWIIGSNAVGKTSVARGVHKFINNSKKSPEIDEEKFDGVKSSVTYFKHSAHLGKLTDGPCSGSDCLTSVAAYKRALKNALSNRSIIVIDGIMATGAWIEWLKTEKTKVMLVFLDIDEETNYERLKLRRGEKRGVPPEEIEITDKTKLNLETKRKGFRSLYGRMEPLVDYSISFRSQHYSLEKIIKTVNHAVFNML